MVSKHKKSSIHVQRCPVPLSKRPPALSRRQRTEQPVSNELRGLFLISSDCSLGSSCCLLTLPPQDRRVIAVCTTSCSTRELQIFLLLSVLFPAVRGFMYLLPGHISHLEL